MGFSDLGCYGGEMHTPNLDRLGYEGLRFTQFYNAARCCPTRASLLTGLYPHQAAIGHMDVYDNLGLDGYLGDLSRNAVTIADVLKAAGYATGAVGKWHVTRFYGPSEPKFNWPLQRGFQWYYGIIGWGGNYFMPEWLARDNTRLSVAADQEYRPEALLCDRRHHRPCRAIHRRPRGEEGRRTVLSVRGLHLGNRALRVGKWKLVAKDRRGPWELYDMEKDRTEMHDLASVDADRVRQMTLLWEQWAKRTKAIPWPWGKPYGKAGNPERKGW